MNNKIIQGDSLEVLKTLESESMDCIVTSPPYWALRDYGVSGQLGLEPTFQEYIEKLCDIFDEAKRVLKSTGTCFVNIGDTYGTVSGAMRDGKFGKKNTNNQQMIQPPGVHKCLCQIPSRFAIEMTNRGWTLRNEIIWHKPNCMPSSAKDRFTVDFEKIYFFTKQIRYFFQTQYENFTSNDYDLARMKGGRKEYNGKWTGANTGENNKQPYKQNNPHLQRLQSAIPGTQRAFVAGGKEGRTKRTVWSINTKPFIGAHFATFPEALIEPMIKAGCPLGGVCLDPFIGAGTTGVVAKKLGRNYLGIELNPEYIKMAEKRIAGITTPMF